MSTIQHLTNALLAHPLEDFPGIIKNSNLSIHELKEASSWKSGEYTRNCLARNEKFELILLCWEPGSKTPLHDHGGEKCWVYQLDGLIEEVRYNQNGKKLIESNRVTLKPGQLTFMNDQMGFHTIENNTAYRSMSLHIYACPIDACKVFNDENMNFELKELCYDNTVQSHADSFIIG